MHQKPKVGIIVLTCPQEISPIPQQAVEIMQDYAQRAKANLSQNDLEVIRVKELIDNADIVSEKVNPIIDQIDCMIFLIGSWPSPALAIDILDKINKRVPIILWAIPSAMIASLVPTCQFHGAFDDMGIPHEFLYSEPEDSAFLDQIKKLAQAAHVANQLHGMNMGLFGGRYMHMYTGTADPIQVKQVFGVEITHINESCLVDAAKNIDQSDVDTFSEQIRSKYGKVNVPSEVEQRSVRLYFAMKKLKQKHKLDFAGVKCMLEVHGSYCSHCLSVSQNLDQGFVVACEADINGAITMQILKMTAGSAPGFGDIFDFNMSENLLKLCNCGAFATEFAADPKDVTFNEQYSHLCPGPGTGMVTSYVCKPGMVTIARLGRIKKEYVMQISRGKSVNMPENTLTPGWEKVPHIFIQKDSDPQVFFQNCRSNHLHWVYGDHVDTLVNICKILGIKSLVC